MDHTHTHTYTVSTLKRMHTAHNTYRCLQIHYDKQTNIGNETKQIYTKPDRNGRRWEIGGREMKRKSEKRQQLICAHTTASTI